MNASTDLERLRDEMAAEYDDLGIGNAYWGFVRGFDRAVQLLTTNETSSKPVVPEPNQKPPSGPPREFWRKMYEKMSSPIDKFKYLCGLKELSWEDCQDAWFESQKLMPEIASAFDAVVAERDALRSACEMLAKVLESVELYPNGHTNMRVKAALAQYEALKRQLAGEK